MKSLDALCKTIARETPDNTPQPSAAEKLASANNLTDDDVNKIAARVVDILSAQTAINQNENADATTTPATNEGETETASNATETTNEDV